MLPILKKRSENGFPTVFIDCAMPDGAFRERLEDYNIHFMTLNKNESHFKQTRPFLDKWLEDKKKLTE